MKVLTLMSTKQELLRHISIVPRTKESDSNQNNTIAIIMDAKKLGRE